MAKPKNGKNGKLGKDEYYEKLDKELTWLANMRDEGVRRIAARSVGLSPEAQQDIIATVEELRRKEHLDD